MSYCIKTLNMNQIGVACHPAIIRGYLINAILQNWQPVILIYIAP